MPGHVLSIEGLALSRVVLALLIGCSVFAGESPFAIYEDSLEIIIWITTLVPRRSVADLKVNDFLASFIYQAMSVACAGLEPCTHSRAELAVAFVGVQRGVPLKYVNKLVLFAVGVTQSRN